MNTLLIYRASAGSGKTFTLATEYIKLLVQNPTAYRNILAVTFTNKATGEMKERILSQLYGIATGDKGSAPYLKKVSEELGLTPEHVQKQCHEALVHLIHDYGRMQVTTIDSFFQTVMRSLARELGLGASMNIELDSSTMLSKAVDRMIEQLDMHSPVFKHLLEYTGELIAEDKSWKVIDAVKEFGRYIFNEEFMEARSSLHECLKDPDFISGYKQQLKKIQKEADAPLQEIASTFFHTLQEAGLDWCDLKNKKKGIGSYFVKLSNKDYSDKIRNATVEKCLSDLKEWRTASSPAALTDRLCDELQTLLNRAESLRPGILYTLNSCKLSLEHLGKVGLLAAIDEEVHALGEQTNRFLLAETNILLRRLIEDGDSSFVFEKIGANIRHVMIDEFQDTSRLQWKNFRMLLIEGLSQGADSLIVGDVKQAIYRWRNGDWGILSGLRGQLGAFPIRDIGELPTVNRRSEEQIIRFNNDFFRSAKEELNDIYKQDQKKNEDCIPLMEAYHDVEQAFPEGKRGGRGYVKITFPEGTQEQTFEEATLQALADEVKELMQQGIRPGDMAILVRKNRFIPLIADYLETALPGISVVSNEAYRLDASPALQILIEALRISSHPEDLIAQANLNRLIGQHLPDFPIATPEEMEKTLKEESRQYPLYELLERLVRHFCLYRMKGQEAYLMTFFDAVAEFIDGGPADPDSFLSHWDERLCGKTIPAGNIDGLRIYSIHNSKGLEFHTVLIPFATWAMENEQPTQTVWCAPPIQPYNRLPLLPVRYGKEMDRSVYHEVFLKERLELWVDNLNILYVAFTRATANLIVFGRKKERTFSVSGLMQRVLPHISSAYDPEEGCFESGAVCLPEQREKTSHQSTNLLLAHSEDLPVRFSSSGRTPEFRQSNASSAFINDDEETARQELYLQQGRLLHYLFSSLHTADDVDPVLKEMEMKGLFSTGLSMETIRKLVTRALSNPTAARWFAPGWELFNECNIVSRDMTDGKTAVRRPDRVMMSPDRQEVIVVDFKFGTPREGYSRQVSEYISLLHRMGYPTVQGYLWYVYTGKIEKVG